VSPEKNGNKKLDHRVIPLKTKFKIHIILSLYLILIFFALLRPFNFDLNCNNAKWLKTKNGIQFNQKGQVISTESTSGLYQMLTEGNGLTLEVWISTYDIIQDGPARILSYSIDTHLRNFTLAQSKDKLVMRLRTEITDQNGIVPHIEVENIFGVNNFYHIIITYNFSNECVFINGKKRVCDYTVSGKFSNWDPSFKLVVGNEATGDRPWLGEIYYVAIYNEALNSREIKWNYEAGLQNTRCSNENRLTNGTRPVVCYLFNEKGGNQIADAGISPYKFNLHIPGRLPVNRPFLYLPSLRDLHSHFFTIDSLLNILGFIPFGFLLHRLVKLRLKNGLQTVAIVLIIGLFISLGCEVLQHFLPSRCSSIIDVFTNMFGLSLGLTINKIVPKLLRL
jgi:hypothetical protein